MLVTLSSDIIKEAPPLYKTEPYMKIQCTFEPQYWGGPKQDYAYPAKPEGPLTWEMDMQEVEHLTGVSHTQPEEIDTDPFARDELRFSTNAPQWIKDWAGPFEVSWEIVEDTVGI